MVTHGFRVKPGMTRGGDAEIAELKRAGCTLYVRTPAGCAAAQEWKKTENHGQFAHATKGDKNEKSY